MVVSLIIVDFACCHIYSEIELYNHFYNIYIGLLP